MRSGLDSDYDYDPFWQRCVDLKVAPASHTPGMGWGSRRSVSSYVSNHIGSFGVSMEASCRSIFLGGVTRRFPRAFFRIARRRRCMGLRALCGSCWTLGEAELRDDSSSRSSKDRYRNDARSLRSLRRRAHEERTGRRSPSRFGSLNPSHRNTMSTRPVRLRRRKISATSSCRASTSDVRRMTGR